MSTAIVGLSRYLLAIFLLFYTFHCFVVFAYPEGRERRVFYVGQNVLMVLIHVTGFYVLSIAMSDPGLIFTCLLQEIMFFGEIALMKAAYPKAQRLIINNMCMLLAVSFIIMTRLSQKRADRQFLIAALGLGLTFAIPYFLTRFRGWKKYTLYYGAAGAGILLAMLLKGAVTNGSRITLTILGITFQPSEIAKVLYVFFVAGMLTDEERMDPESGRPDKPSLILLCAGSLLYVLILTVCKDLGGALIFFVVFVFMCYAGLRMPAVLLGGGIAGSLAALAGYRLFAHVRNRVRAWRDPFGDIEGAGYQLGQSLFAIGTGSWFGMGLMKGSPDKIPVVEADFIFSAISEEMGCIFSLCIILICISNFLMFMNISMMIKDPYYRLVSLGLAVNYGFQVFLTVGGVTCFIPLTGVTLPLVSYGGTSILSTLVMFSVIQGLYILHHEEA